MEKSKPPSTQSKTDTDSNETLQDEQANKKRSKRLRPNSSPNKKYLIDDTTPELSNINLMQSLSTQTTLLSKLAGDMDALKKQNAEIQKSNQDIHKINEEIKESISFMNIQFELLKNEVEYLKKERQQQQQYITELERKLLDTDHKSRSSCIEIRNIPPLEQESVSKLNDLLCNISQAAGLPISPSDLRDVYRLPGKTSTTRPIIVEFSTVLRKQQLLSFVRKFNNQKLANDKLNTKLIGLPGNQKPVYIEEKIPSRTKTLYLQAREFRKKNKYAFCWCSNGNIFLRKKEGDKQIIIRSEQCLVDLQKNIL
ncbi:unnamed protein product [Leptidea sinapis]|uniref:FP protein C-terminal domain-containing protein n=1 Tax=Leptidea sinapis TaxID=189913 RepID=A0A5E4QJN0_9NEOP|nr:unnamed protein product [Leptidea sinapis]